jgi:hypothetical protein
VIGCCFSRTSTSSWQTRFSLKAMVRFRALPKPRSVIAEPAKRRQPSD